ncbi:MAG: hypothetical protein WBL84_18575 [Xanthobacteraceae bacterium]
MVLISGPVIAKLALRTRKWAHEHMRRGSFGAVTVDSCGVLFADFAEVNRCLGPITQAQLERAAGGIAGRIITIPDIEEAA